MIIIYSADTDTGRLFTDPKQHFYVDGPLMHQRATAIRTAHVLDLIAQKLGYRDYKDFDATTTASGFTKQVALEMIINGSAARYLRRKAPAQNLSDPT